MKTKMITLVFSCLFACSLLAQEIIWEQTYPGPGDSSLIISNPAFDVALTADGGFILAGTKVYGNALNHHFLEVIKTDESGNQEWAKLYFHEPNNFEFKSTGHVIQETAEGDFFVAGGLYVNHEPRALLMKINSVGDTLWTKVYNPNFSDEILAMHLMADGGTLLVGRGVVFNPESQSGILLIRTDADGNLLWTKTHFDVGGSAEDITPTPDGNFMLTGGAESGALLAKITPQGDLLWITTLGFSKQDLGFSIKPVPNEGYIVSGVGSGFAGYFPILFKVDEAGVPFWTPQLSLGLGTARSVVTTADGGAVITGSGWDIFPLFNTSGYVLKVNEDGEEVWKILLSEKIEGFHIEALDDETFIVSGNADKKMYLAKIGLPVSTSEVEKNRIQVNISPNPVLDKMFVKINDSIQGSFQFSIFDLTGKLVYSRKVKTTEFEVSRGALHSGIYVYKIENEEGLMSSGKLIFE